MIVSQLGKLTGVPTEGDSVPAEIASFVTELGRWHAPTAALSALLLVVLLVGGWLRPHWPGHMTAFSATYRGWPACTMSTTIPAPGRCPAWWSTATTHRCASPTPRT
ncbi:MAG: hypothetical protein ACRDTZ_23825, partial [Pseudonocardiaceae bacterium]